MNGEGHGVTGNFVIIMNTKSTEINGLVQEHAYTVTDVRRWQNESL